MVRIRFPPAESQANFSPSTEQRGAAAPTRGRPRAMRADRPLKPERHASAIKARRGRRDGAILTPKWVDGTAVAGRSFMIHIRHAAAAIASGLCETVLITQGESGRFRPGSPDRVRTSPGPALARRRPVRICPSAEQPTQAGEGGAEPPRSIGQIPAIPPPP